MVGVLVFGVINSMEKRLDDTLLTIVDDEDGDNCNALRLPKFGSVISLLNVAVNDLS